MGKLSRRMRRQKKVPRRGQPVTLPARIQALERLLADADDGEFHSDVESFLHQTLDLARALLRDGNRRDAQFAIAQLERIVDVDRKIARYDERIAQLSAQIRAGEAALDDSSDADDRNEP